MLIMIYIKFMRYAAVCIICLVYLISCSSLSIGDNSSTFNLTSTGQNESLFNETLWNNGTLKPIFAPPGMLSKLGGGNLSISGTVFNDLNGTGLRTKDDPGLSGWTIVLNRDGSEILETSNDTGQYSFANLKPGNYTVEEKKQAGWNQTYPADEAYDINLEDKNAYNYDFGNHFGPVTFVPKKHGLMSLNAWIKRANAVKNLSKVGISPAISANFSYPASFSLLSHLSYVPGERDQGYCGDCWVWGCTGAIEVAHDIQNGIHDRLSIQYLNSNYHGGSGSWACCGGDEITFSDFYASKGMFIPWANANANFQDAGRSCSGSTSVPASSISTSTNYPITSIQWHAIDTTSSTTAQAINNIKNIIYQNKAVTFAFYLPTTAAWSNFDSFWNYGLGTDIWDPTPYCGVAFGTGNGGHLVTCVGWDDSSNSWIMLNSWGTTSNRPDGTFRVKMDMPYTCQNSGYYSYGFGYFDTAFGGVPTSAWSGLGGYATSSPSVVVDDQGRTETWIRGGDNRLWVNMDGIWYTSPGGQLTSDPFAVNDNNGKVHVLVRGTDYAAWDLIFDTGTLGYHWKGLGGYLTSAPTAALEPTYHNFLRVAAKGGDNGLWQCDLNVNTESSSWSGSGGYLTSGPYIIFDPASRQHTLVRGGDNGLWDCEGVIGTDSNYHFNWTGLGGYLTSGPTASIEPGWTNYVAVFVKGGDNALWMNDLYSGSTPESGNWHYLGGLITSTPVAVDTSAGRIHTFVRGNDDALWENVFTTSPWTPGGTQWHGLGGALLSYNTGATVGSSTQAFVIGTDSAVWQNTHTTFSASSGGSGILKQDEPEQIDHPPVGPNSGSSKN